MKKLDLVDYIDNSCVEKGGFNPDSEIELDEIPDMRS